MDEGLVDIVSCLGRIGLQSVRFIARWLFIKFMRLTEEQYQRIAPPKAERTERQVKAMGMRLVVPSFNNAGWTWNFECGLWEHVLVCQPHPITGEAKKTAANQNAVPPSPFSSGRQTLSSRNRGRGQGRD